MAKWSIECAIATAKIDGQRVDALEEDDQIVSLIVIEIFDDDRLWLRIEIIELSWKWLECIRAGYP